MYKLNYLTYTIRQKITHCTLYIIPVHYTPHRIHCHDNSHPTTSNSCQKQYEVNHRIHTMCKYLDYL